MFGGLGSLRIFESFWRFLWVMGDLEDLDYLGILRALVLLRGLGSLGV